MVVGNFRYCYLLPITIYYTILHMLLLPLLAAAFSPFFTLLYRDFFCPTLYKIKKGQLMSL